MLEGPCNSVIETQWVGASGIDMVTSESATEKAGSGTGGWTITAVPEPSALIPAALLCAFIVRKTIQLNRTHLVTRSLPREIRSQTRSCGDVFAQRSIVATVGVPIRSVYTESTKSSKRDLG
jgi:hypothetical protein